MHCFGQGVGVVVALAGLGVPCQRDRVQLARDDKAIGCRGRDEPRAGFNKLAGSKCRRWPGKGLLSHTWNRKPLEALR